MLGKTRQSISRVRALSRWTDRQTDRQTRPQQGETSVLVVPLHQVLCVFDGQHPTLSGEITLSQAGRGWVGWDGMGWIDGVVLLLLFVVALDSNRKIHGTWPTWRAWAGTYRNGVSKYKPIGTYRFVVLCTGYGTYQPLVSLSLNLKTSLWPGPDLGSSPPPWPLPRGGPSPHKVPSHARGPGQPKQIPPSTSQLHSPPLSIVLLMTQAQIPWEGVPVLRCFSGKIHPPSTLSHHSPSRGTSAAPTQPNQGRASITFTSRLPLPTVYYCPPSSSSHYLQLQLHNDDLTLPAQYPTTGLSKEQSSHKSSTSLGSIHISLHALCRPQCPPIPRSLHSVIAHRP